MCALKCNLVVQYIYYTGCNIYTSCIKMIDTTTLKYVLHIPAGIEGFHMMSQQPNRASHAIHSRHVGSFFALSSIGKSHKICSHSLLLNFHKAKLHRSSNVINIYSLTASLTCSNEISKK